MNNLFKRVLIGLNLMKDHGNNQVRFLQAVGPAINLRKIAKTLLEKDTLFRYGGYKRYRNFTYILSMFFRYRNPQPFVEQIAFEMEKTKKH